MASESGPRPADLPTWRAPAAPDPAPANLGGDERRQLGSEAFAALPELAGATLSADTLGHSQAQVWHVAWPDGREAWLKEQPAGGPEPLRHDCELLTWLKGRVTVPEVREFGAQGV